MQRLLFPQELDFTTVEWIAGKSKHLTWDRSQMQIFRSFLTDVSGEIEVMFVEKRWIRGCAQHNCVRANHHNGQEVLCFEIHRRALLRV